MFELPNAKRVKRSKLFSSFSSSSSEDEIEGSSAASRIDLSKVESQAKKHKSRADRNSADENDAVVGDVKVDYGFEYEFVEKAVEGPSEQQSNTVINNASAGVLDISTISKHGEKQPAEPKEETYSFNLFAPKSRPAASPGDTDQSAPESAASQHQQQHQITLRPATPPQHSLTLDLTSSTTGRILQPRPLTHYFTSSLPTSSLSALKAQYVSAAISGSDILSFLSQQPWPGTSLSRRVIHVPPSQLIRHIHTTTITTNIRSSSSNSSNSGGTRPSKKRRIQLRQRQKARAAAMAALSAERTRTEEAEREKRTRRNREKKVKRKVREKAKKTAATAAVAEAGEEVGNGDGNGNGNEDEQEKKVGI